MSLFGLHVLEFTTYVSLHPLCVTSHSDIHMYFLLYSIFVTEITRTETEFVSNYR